MAQTAESNMTEEALLAPPGAARVMAVRAPTARAALSDLAWRVQLSIAEAARAVAASHEEKAAE